MKIAISGKGGVGKTTVSAMLAAALAAKNRRVIAIDADPDANLAAALGISPRQNITPLSEMDELIAERTGSKAGYGGYFKLNPKVDDIPESYALAVGEHIRLLVLGGVSIGGGGCICPASALLKALLVHLILAGDEALVMDMEAGIEHLGRATAGSMDALIIVVDESPWSLQTAARVRQLAGDIGLKKLFVVANRITEPADLQQIRAGLDGLELIGQIPCDPRLQAGVLQTADRDQPQLTDAMKDHLPAVESVLAKLESRI